MKNICNLCRKEIDSKLYTCENCFNLIKNKLNIKIAYNYKDKVYTITSTTRKIDEYSIVGICPDFIKKYTSEIIYNKDINMAKDDSIFICYKPQCKYKSFNLNEIYKSSQECLEANVNYLAELNINKITTKFKQELMQLFIDKFKEDKTFLNKYIEALNSKDSLIDIFINEYIKKDKSFDDIKDNKILLEENSIKISQECLEKDMSFADKQTKITDLLTDLLKSDIGIEMNLTGLNTQIFNGYINNSWLYGNRSKNDIKE